MTEPAGQQDNQVVRYDPKYVESVIRQHRQTDQIDPQAVAKTVQETARFVATRGFQQQVDNFIARNYTPPVPQLTLNTRHAHAVITTQAEPPCRASYLIAISENGQALAHARGHDNNSTPRRMEITAAIQVLDIVAPTSLITIETPTQYMPDAVNNGWLGHWEAQDWNTNQNRPLHNADLWQQLLQSIRNRPAKTITFTPTPVATTGRQG